LKTSGAPDENVSQRREQAEWVYDSCRFREQKEIPVKLETAVPKAHDPKGTTPSMALRHRLACRRAENPGQ
jgi:hypothetical protein